MNISFGMLKIAFFCVIIKRVWIYRSKRKAMPARSYIKREKDNFGDKYEKSVVIQALGGVYIGHAGGGYRYRHFVYASLAADMV